MFGLGTRNRAGQGFTLIELAVAIAILAIGGLAGFRAINLSIAQTDHARTLLFGQAVAMNRAAELRHHGALSVDSLPGRVRFAGADWDVTTEVAATAAGFVETDIVVFPTGEAPSDGNATRLVAYVAP